MEIIKIIVLSLGMSLTYILITLITSFFIYKKIKLPDIINWKVLILNSLFLSIPFFLTFLGLPILFETIEVSEIIINIVAFLVLSVVPTYEYLISPLVIINNNRLVEIELSNNLKSIISKLKVFKVHKNFANAYAIGVLPNSKSIILSGDLFTRMSEKELDGIIAHELGHLKENHLFKLYISSLLALLIGYLSTFYFYPMIEQTKFNIHILRAIHGAFFYGLPLWIIPSLFQRNLEYRADSYASRVVGKNNYINALKKLNEITNGKVKEGGLTHPSLDDRINNILR